MPDLSDFMENPTTPEDSLLDDRALSDSMADRMRQAGEIINGVYDELNKRHGSCLCTLRRKLDPPAQPLRANTGVFCVCQATSDRTWETMPQLIETLDRVEREL
jgi:hypothetical protein